MNTMTGRTVTFAAVDLADWQARMDERMLSAGIVQYPALPHPIERSLSVAEAVALGTLLDACARGHALRWLNEHGDVDEGVARCVVRDHGGGAFLTAADDVRDGFVHVSGIVEQWLPVERCVRQLIEGELAIEPRDRA